MEDREKYLREKLLRDHSVPSNRRQRRWDVSSEPPVAPTIPATVKGKQMAVDATPTYLPVIPPTPMATRDEEPREMSVGSGSLEDYDLTDQQLDELLPSTGYAILEPPASYVPIQSSAPRLLGTPKPLSSRSSGLSVPAAPSLTAEDRMLLQPGDDELFPPLFSSKTDEEVSLDDLKLRKVARLLLRIKAGSNQMRRSSMRQLIDKSLEFGPSGIFDMLLPIVVSQKMQAQERHIFIKLIDRLLFKLQDAIRPFTHRILLVISPMLMEDDRNSRLEAREVLSNLAKAVGLATMIATLRPDIDHADEQVRNTAARAFSVVASALGLSLLLPFLKALCGSKKNVEARHTGLKIVQQIAILMGKSIIPNLGDLVNCVVGGLEDSSFKIRNMCALAISALAESAAPFGAEAFKNAPDPLVELVKNSRGRGLAAAMKAFSSLIPILREDISSQMRTAIPVAIREFQSTDDDLLRVMLGFLSRSCTFLPTLPLLRSELIPSFHLHCWNRRMVLDKRNARSLVECTVEITKVDGFVEALTKLIPHLKDEAEPLRNCACEALKAIMENVERAIIPESLQDSLVDGLMMCFNAVSSQESLIVVSTFEAIIKSLGIRLRPYLSQICSSILWKLSNRSAVIRVAASNLTSKLAPCMVECRQEALLSKVSAVLYENLGEEYPEVLASIIRAMKAIFNSLGTRLMTPKPAEILLRLNPILRNRNELVQHACIDLIGMIANILPESVSPREWMRISFELIDVLRAQNRQVRRSAIQTFGFIAKAIGPQDVLIALLNNLKVQERQNRICTTIAIAIVADSCGPFTVIPSLMTEYRVPELNVQNGVLKALAYMFEYIGPTSKDYIYSVTTLLEDALTDRDLVHRQTASVVLKHVSLGVYGAGCEEALVHLLNMMFPNVYEKSPHVFFSVFEAVEALRVSLGPGIIFLYLIQGLFHPARRVREVYWLVYNQVYISAPEQLCLYYPATRSDSVKHEACQYLSVFN